MTSRGEIVAERPVPGHPRAYEFPATRRTQLGNGLRVAVVPMPGRALVSASLVIRSGASDEPAELGGAVLGRALSGHGGPRRDRADRGGGAARRLAHAEAGWDATSAGLDVPASRLRQRSSCSRRCCSGRPSRSTRSSGCATSA
jgi:hypothetical protein